MGRSVAQPGQHCPLRGRADALNIRSCPTISVRNVIRPHCCRGFAKRRKMAVGSAALRPHQWHCQDAVMRTLLLGRGRGGILSPVPTFIQHNISFHCCLNVKARLVLIMSPQKYLAPLLKLAVCFYERHPPDPYTSVTCSCLSKRTVESVQVAICHTAFASILFLSL